MEWREATEMAQGIEALAAKPGDLSSIPRTHMVEGEKCLLQVVLWPPHVGHGTRVLYHMNNK